MIEVRLPAALELTNHVLFENLAILLRDDLRVIQLTECRQIELGHQGHRVALPVPDLTRWRRETPAVVSWEGIMLPQLDAGCPGGVPDLIGLAYYLFEDTPELAQEAQCPGERYDIDRSPVRDVYRQNYLDRAIRRVAAALSVPAPSDCGVILTHDLDFLSLASVRRFKPEMAHALATFRAGGRRASLRAAVSLLHERVRNPGAFREEFEFLDWAAAEEAYGFRSVFFVLPDGRRRTSPVDGTYSFSARSRRDTGLRLRAALRGLIRRGFVLGPHLSRSSNYEPGQIRREFASFTRELGVPVTVTRNHWLWMQYSDWYDHLSEHRVQFDMNAACIGYTKGTSAPYFNRTAQTMTFPTTFMDDVVLKSHRMGLTREQALALLDEQLDAAAAHGGFPAIAFHPAEDGPHSSPFVPNKLELYRDVLGRIHAQGMRVWLPEEASARVRRRVTWVCG